MNIYKSLLIIQTIYIIRSSKFKFKRRQKEKVLTMVGTLEEKNPKEPKYLLGFACKMLASSISINGAPFS